VGRNGTARIVAVGFKKYQEKGSCQIIKKGPHVLNVVTVMPLSTNQELINAAIVGVSMIEITN